MEKTELELEIESLSKNLAKYSESLNNIDSIDNIESAQKKLLLTNLHLDEDFLDNLKSLNKYLIEFDETLIDHQITNNPITIDTLDLLRKISGKSANEFSKFFKYRLYHRKISNVITLILFVPWLNVLFNHFPVTQAVEKFFNLMFSPLDFLKSLQLHTYLENSIGLILGLSLLLISIILLALVGLYIFFLPIIFVDFIGKNVLKKKYNSQ
jgi:hypothetical protein